MKLLQPQNMKIPYVIQVSINISDADMPDNNNKNHFQENSNGDVCNKKANKNDNGNMGQNGYNLNPNYGSCLNLNVNNEMATVIIHGSVTNEDDERLI